MFNVKMFKEQHDELLAIAEEIATHLNITELSNDTDVVKKLFVKLLGKLSVHLSLEDEWLYPKLQEHPDDSVKEMAKRFVDEMGGIGQAVADYKDKWIITSAAISKNPETFIDETNNLFGTLAQRIEKENNELYKSMEGL